MLYVADLHIHSHFSIATSGESDPVHLFEAAARKGIQLVGTGDFTHPGWREELAQSLEPDDGSGLLRLKPELEHQVRRRLSGPAAGATVRFILSSEISSIYKKGGRARKVHNVILMPSLEAATRLSDRLERIGNIRSDGRPILGLDCRDLLEMSLATEPDCCFIPAHIWTPHFSVFGSKSGFDRMEDCYGDLTGAIYAVETGLSSDPPMNWRLSALDRFALVSNSDAHSPDKLAREANLIDGELSWQGLTGALRSRDPQRFVGTLEFHPEEGKYHYDGHRSCGVRLHPDEVAALGGRCPVCGGKLTGGVYGRVVELADRPDGAHPAAAREFEHLVPLREILAEVLDSGPATKKTQALLERVTSSLGTELEVLRHTPLEDIARLAGPLAAEAVRRTRAGELSVDPGYDGEFGTVRIFAPGERDSGAGQMFFFAAESAPQAGEPSPAPAPSRTAIKTPRTVQPVAETATAAPQDPLAALDPAQREAVVYDGDGPVAVAAGPGTGKTRCLAARVLHLLRERAAAPGSITAITFTNRAAEEMKSRIENQAGALLEGRAGRPFVGTFHAWCLDCLGHAMGHTPVLLDENERLQLLRECLEPGGGARQRQVSEAISLAAARLESPDSYRGPEAVRAAWTAYRALCERLGVLDFDSLITETVRLLSHDPDTLAAARAGAGNLLVDEFQDVNPAQYELVRWLAGPGGAGLFVIGDPNQSIYAFRGAAPDIFERLSADYPAAKVMNLTTGYRCSPVVTRASAALIAAGGSPWRAPQAVCGPETPLQQMRCPSETAEAIAVVREVTRLAGGASMLEAHGQGRAGRRSGAEEDDCDYSFGDMLVVARTGALLEELERAFVVEGLPCRVRASRSFLADREVQGLLALLRLAAAAQDNLHFRGALRLAG
ncbi:UvrD-helicase domain-containing protein, partial [bacterium]|nr:UvrD-helicase domain-containing protein [bacterium]